jgi:hypothetical protein
VRREDDLRRPTLRVTAGQRLANVTAQARAHGVPFELSNLVERIHRRALSR